MAPTSEQASIIANLKSGLSELSIPILSDQTSVTGFLIPITHRLAEDRAIVDALFRWRRAHMKTFLTVFTPTLEKTRNYLTCFSLPDPARILFLAADREGRRVGHIGLCNITADGAEIDNVVRGESIDNPDFMVQAHSALLGWAFSTLDISLAYLNVLAHNQRALRTYRRVGFREVARTRLVREEQEDGYRLRPASKSNRDAAVATLIRMEIPRDAFGGEQIHQSYLWLAQLD